MLDAGVSPSEDWIKRLKAADGVEVFISLNLLNQVEGLIDVAPRPLPTAWLALLIAQITAASRNDAPCPYYKVVLCFQSGDAG